MINKKKIGVVVPAYNEHGLIKKTLETIPDFVDFIATINDCSVDDTKDIILNISKKDKRIILIDHKVNKGLGQSLIDGYCYLRKMKVDVIAVMAGDAQMDPHDLINVVKPIVDGEADYVKGYRLLADNVKNIMPKYRYFGNMILTILTKFATGYWHIIDPQCGYTAISLKAITEIPIEDMTKGYGYNADILNMLNLKNYVVKDVPVKPIYDKEKSKIKLGKYIVKTSLILIKLFNKRIKNKYLLTDFNPLALFYITSIISIFVGFLLLIRIIVIYFSIYIMPSTTLILWIFFTLLGLQSLFFAMWMDMEANKELKCYEKKNRN